MQAIIQSVFLQALAQSLIASIWQMALLWLACLGTMKIFRLSSAQKFSMAFIAQVSGLGLFIYTFIISYKYPQNVPVFTSNTLFNVNSAVLACMPYLAVVYLFVLVLKFNKVGFMYMASKKMKHNQLVKIGVEHRLFVQQMAETLSIHKKVKIYLSEKINCPLTIGFFKPVILIPLAAVNHLSTQQMEAVILHELAHIKRADYLLYILQSVIDKIFFFNVFSRMLSTIIERERENACDDWVMQFRYSSMHYAEALFKLGRLKALPVLAMPLSGKKENLLLARIKRILHKQTDNNFYNSGSVGLSFSSVAVVGFLCVLSYCKPAAETTVFAENKVIGNAFTANRPTENIDAIIAQPESVVYKETPIVAKAVKNSVQTKEAAIIKREKALATIEKDRMNAVAVVGQKLYKEAAALQVKQNYLVQVQARLDSLQVSFPQIEQAVNAQVVVTPEMAQKALSYQNFKQIERMLAASSDSIKITESPDTKNTYQKQITIESKDKDGNKHVYTVVIQLYQ